MGIKIYIKDEWIRGYLTSYPTAKFIRSIVRQDIKEWFKEHKITTKVVLERSFDYDESYCNGWYITDVNINEFGHNIYYFDFEDKDQAILFKLTWI